MRTLKGSLIALVSVWLAAGLNMGMASKVSIFGGRPDFLLIVLATLGLFLGRSGGAMLGFLCGLVFGSLAGANLAPYCISRTIAGFGAGWLNEAGFQPSAPMAAISALLVTIFAQLLVMFAAPPPQITPFLWDTLGKAIYNGVLAMPYFLLVTKLFEQPSK